MHSFLFVFIIFACFKGQHLNLLEYQSHEVGCLAELFRVLENHRVFLQIKHYPISQTTLEQVFGVFFLIFLFFFLLPPYPPLCLNMLCIVIIDVVEYCIICWIIQICAINQQFQAISDLHSNFMNATAFMLKVSTEKHHRKAHIYTVHKHNQCLDASISVRDEKVGL